MPIRSLLLLLLLALPARGEIQWHELAPADGSGPGLTYALVLPDDFDGTAEYPVLLALPPGAQDRAMVEAGLERYWGRQAAEAGWIVVSPVAPGGRTFSDGAWKDLAPLLDHVAVTWNVEGRRMHLAGASNGGLAAFLVAAEWPERFRSLTALPGYPPPIWDAIQLHRLSSMPIRMFVGGDDTRWRERMERAARHMRDAGLDVSLDVLEGEGHIPASLDGGAVMEHLKRLRSELRQARRPDDERRAVELVLDQLHRSAARAEERLYFECFAPNAVFLGTDPDERWSLAEFRAWARPHFDAGKGWSYAVRARHVTVAPGGGVAWFDEVLENARLGECRGSGVLALVDDEWRIVQYNLSIPIPNALADEVVERIRERGRGEDGGRP